MQIKTGNRKFLKPARDFWIIYIILRKEKGYVKDNS